MLFREKSRIVNARKLTSAIKTEQGELVAEAQDWIADVDGRQVIYRASDFIERYEPLYKDNPLLSRPSDCVDTGPVSDSA